MQSRLVYVELKSGYSDDGPAWIGYAAFSKSGRTIYFNGQALKRSARGENHYNLETGDKYWVSGIKKEGSNRHWAGHGKIMIDKDAVTEYLEFRNLTELSKIRYEVVFLNNIPPKQYLNEIENTKIEY
jgi:hypothetical protein